MGDERQRGQGDWERAIPRPLSDLELLFLTYLSQYRILFTNRRHSNEGSMRILAVEDEPEYLEMLQEVMQSIGHSIVIALNGAEALDMLGKQKIDVVVSDVKMPTMNGIEFHQR